MKLPPVFYKYAPSSTACLVLESSKLRWSSPLLFNDIAEFQRMPRFHPRVADSYQLLTDSIVSTAFDGVEIDEARLTHQTRLLLNSVKQMASEGCIKREDVLKGLAGEVADADQRIEMSLRDCVENLGLSTARVLCVTSDNDNNAMWGNYAESHTGCVLGFRHIIECSTPLLAATRVSYSTEPPVVGTGLDFLLYGNTAELRKRTLNSIFYTKDQSWEYEREWRVITWRRDEVGAQFSDFLFYPDELESVTLGVRATSITEECVRHLLAKKYPSASLYRMRLSCGKLERELLASVD
ncbi:DUF2971 domain-containing protein [Pseudomonas weihenstephanensis]|uniref:DUF2971 domain-containing protein n=1 Tax=Pseudomonas weihenstephanensis TaxID=1608994 RepID=UPI00193C1A31|nr:DUF2971 domain-containing protein [Pseudomonas weihenstephanensis]MBM1192583.1 DUF2971 domain-containing protein [Pseudomonas weihenstephanensis]